MRERESRACFYVRRMLSARKSEISLTIKSSGGDEVIYYSKKNDNKPRTCQEFDLALARQPSFTLSNEQKLGVMAI